MTSIVAHHRRGARDRLGVPEIGCKDLEKSPDDPVPSFNATDRVEGVDEQRWG